MFLVSLGAINSDQTRQWKTWPPPPKQPISLLQIMQHFIKDCYQFKHSSKTETWLCQRLDCINWSPQKCLFCSKLYILGSGVSSYLSRRKIVNEILFSELCHPLFLLCSRQVHTVKYQKRLEMSDTCLQDQKWQWPSSSFLRRSRGVVHSY